MHGVHEVMTGVNEVPRSHARMCTVYDVHGVNEVPQSHDRMCTVYGVHGVNEVPQSHARMSHHYQYVIKFGVVSYDPTMRDDRIAFRVGHPSDKGAAIVSRGDFAHTCALRPQQVIEVWEISSNFQPWVQVNTGELTSLATLFGCV